MFGGNEEPHFRQIFSTVRWIPSSKKGFNPGADGCLAGEVGGDALTGWVWLGGALVWAPGI